MKRGQRNRCPVCRFDKTFEGKICSSCVANGYRVQEDGKVRRADASLIAVAPEMLQALKDCYVFLEDQTECACDGPGEYLYICRLCRVKNLIERVEGKII
jgi:hypothetical protein